LKGLRVKLATCCPLKTSCRTSHPGFSLCFVKSIFTGVALKEWMVSIHRPLGYGLSTLPLRHSALFHPRWDSNPQSLGSLHFQLSGLASARVGLLHTPLVYGTRRR